MDKFGIFNLLSTLLSKNNVNSDISAADNFADAPSLSGGVSETKAANARATLPPLQHAMLLTMKSHDEFVKRVKAKNQKQ